MTQKSDNQQTDQLKGSDYLEVLYLRQKKVFGGTVPPAKKLFGGTVPPAKKLFGGTVPPTKKLFGGTVQYTWCSNRK